MREELEGGSGGTCHNDKPGPNAGYGASRYDGGEGEGGRRWKSKTCNSSKPRCVLGEMEAKRREMGVMERKEWGDTEEAGPATMTSRALNVGMTDGWV